MRWYCDGNPLPQAEGLTAIEAWVIVCVLFVFGALIEYAGLLLKMKLATTRSARLPSFMSTERFSLCFVSSNKANIYRVEQN